MTFIKAIIGVVVVAVVVYYGLDFLAPQHTSNTTSVTAPAAQSTSTTAVTTTMAASPASAASSMGSTAQTATQTAAAGVAAAASTASSTAGAAVAASTAAPVSAATTSGSTATNGATTQQPATNTTAANSPSTAGETSASGATSSAATGNTASSAATGQAASLNNTQSGNMSASEGASSAPGSTESGASSTTGAAGTTTASAPASGMSSKAAASQPKPSHAAARRTHLSTTGKREPKPRHHVAIPKVNIPAPAPWWATGGQVKPEQFRLVYAGSAAGKTAIVLLFSQPVASVQAANQLIHVTGIDRSVTGHWKAGSNPRMLILSVPAGHYTVTLEPGLKDTQGQALPNRLSGKVNVY